MKINRRKKNKNLIFKSKINVKAMTSRERQEALH